MAVRFPDPQQPVDPEESNCYKFTQMVAVCSNGKYDGELWYPFGVAIDCKTNQIYIAEGYYNFARVSIFSENGDFLKTFRHKQMSRPWDIAIHEDNLYMTDAEEHCVYHLKLAADIRFIATLGGKGSGAGEFHDPRQLAVSTNGEVFVSDRNNHRIQILDSCLHYKRRISHQSLHYPRGIKLTPDEVYILSDTDSPCVHVFSHAGDKIRALIPRGPGKQIYLPYFFCLDENENLIISDWGSHRIKIFSEEGTLIHTLGKRGHGLEMFDYPCGIAYTNNSKLIIVSLNENYRLQIFSRPNC